MPQRNLAPASISKSILRLATGASISIFIYGCSGQTSNQPPLPPAQPPVLAPPVAAAPHEVGHPKVTTASFYGPELQGHTTSSGETYNQHAMTAASRTLPIGSHARVTNLKTGKSVVVRINDHGPFVKGRGIDLSRAAAHEIGIDHRGTAKVRVTRLEETSGHEGDSWSGTVDVRDTPPPVTPQVSRQVTPQVTRQVTAIDYANRTNPPATESGVSPSSPSAVGSWSMELGTPSSN
jgi:rare lipoprotein A